MKVKEMIEQLKKYDQELDVQVFAGGNTFEPIAFQLWKDNDVTVFEIGCGWNPIDE